MQIVEGLEPVLAGETDDHGVGAAVGHGGISQSLTGNDGV